MTTAERVESVLEDLIDWLGVDYNEDLKERYLLDLSKVLIGPAVDGYQACRRLEDLGWAVDFHLAEILDLV